MSKVDEHFEYEVSLSLVPEDEEIEISLSEEQLAAIDKIVKFGFRRAGHYSDGMHFVDERDGSSSRGKGGFLRSADIRVTDLPAAASGLDIYKDHTEFRGVMSHDGASAEFLIGNSSSTIPVGKIIESYSWRYAEPDCGHIFEPYVIKRKSRTHEVGFHLRSPNLNACVEISPISPIATLLAYDLGYYTADNFSEHTLKVMLGSSSDVAANSMQVQQLAHDLLFELDAKYGLVLSLIPRERGRLPFLSRKPPMEWQSISFPSTRVPREVAAIFSFAGEAQDNPPFAFLSYYQVLEYYLPFAARRDALKRVRREIRDFAFDVSDDASVLRVLNVAERAKGVGEEEALKILVRDCVREDKLIEVLKGDGFIEHFSRKGPIKGVPAINLSSTSETVQVQVARRVYALRNRIVHAKDDPKYSETPQLLPRSSEANLLGPDILLARFLALETIIDAQD
ncbi:hypothetical protein [Streptomyces olivaceus]|uniref:hypothetical protein n=1 Tax=Streptomyces olivaceus TaxID=47716 RepID=UPI001CCF449B|nr:hypothetical protein [Streptomyces olivaceus]MBZ6227876.1 hypothetical protein [Streptomyces olivaceus]